jgi:hypothetical protein
MNSISIADTLASTGDTAQEDISRSAFGSPLDVMALIGGGEGTVTPY